MWQIDNDRLFGWIIGPIAIDLFVLNFIASISSSSWRDEPPSQLSGMACARLSHLIASPLSLELSDPFPSFSVRLPLPFSQSPLIIS